MELNKFCENSDKLKNKLFTFQTFKIYNLIIEYEMADMVAVISRKNTMSPIEWSVLILVDT